MTLPTIERNGLLRAWMVGRPVLTVDPGTSDSAWCVWSDGRVVGATTGANRELLDFLDSAHRSYTEAAPVLAVESIDSYGMPVGREVFRTAMWIGRFIQAWGREYHLMPRRLVKLTLCGSPRAKDANIRQAVIDRLGPLPTKRAPNPNYGPRRPSSHEWSAIALALTYAELVREGRAGELETLEAKP